MTPDEARDLARLGGRAATGVAGLVEHTHHGVTEQVYRAVAIGTGGASTPVHRIHDLVARHTFFWVRQGLGAAAWAAATIAPRSVRGTGRQQATPDGPSGQRDRSALDTVRAQLALGIVNGVTGDRLAQDGSTLAIPMSLRHEGHDVAPTTEALRAAYGSGQERVVVFVHGLVETEHAWRFRSQQRWGERGVSYASRLVAETDWLPVLVRYNTGAPIARNAADFAALLSSLVGAWPGPLREVVIVGHSMGGLVALRAVAEAEVGAEAAWTRVVRAVITLGSPREGAPLERFAVVAEEVAESSGHGRWFGGLVGLRSDGIRDLRHPIDHPPLPDWVREYAVLATLTPESWHPTVPRVGDGLVPVPTDQTEHTVVLPRLHHLDLLNHPSVYAHLRAWLDPASPANT